MKIKMKIYDKERRCIYETAVSIARCFGDYVGRCRPPGFSDCDFTPQPDRYEPIICTFYKDRSGQELWSGDLVRVQHPTAEPSVTLECVIEYSEYDAAFVFVPRENPESTYPLFGMDSELIERVGSIYEKTGR
jgi:hypothetical protein